MKEIREQLEEKLVELENISHEAQYRLKCIGNKDDRHICVNRRGSKYQLYVIDKYGKRQYLREENIDVASNIVKNAYYNRTLNTVKEQRTAINRFLKCFDENAIKNIYNNLGEGRRQFISPVIPTDEDFIELWLQENSGEQNPYPENAKYITENGEYVRSKSEKIIADMFHKYNIPYQYEPILKLKNKKNLYPDFIVLNVRERKTYYWEHLGLASEETYATKNLEKILIYEKNGIFLGQDLILTIETEYSTLDIKQIENKIRTYLL